MVYHSLLCKSTCSDARSAVCCQGDYCMGCRGVRDSLRKHSFLQFYFILVTHHGNLPAMTLKAGRHQPAVALNPTMGSFVSCTQINGLSLFYFSANGKIKGIVRPKMKIYRSLTLMACLLLFENAQTACFHTARVNEEVSFLSFCSVLSLYA